jgi:hypothetical protein
MDRVRPRSGEAEPAGKSELPYKEDGDTQTHSGAF